MEIELEERCPRCGLGISNDEYAFCLKCGTDLLRKGVRVECCNRLVTDPWAIQYGYIPFCPFCGKRTGQKPRAQIEAAMQRQKQHWADEEAQRKRVVDPPLLSGVKIQVRPHGAELINDLVEELNHYDRYPVAVVESVDQAQTLFKAFTGNAKRLATSEGQLVLDMPTRENAEVINDRFQHRKPVFTTAGILPVLSLQYANRFFMAAETISDGLLSALGSLGSYGLNQSKGATIFEYQTEGLPERLARYRDEEAEIITGGQEK